jgi:hypothetical protein
LRSYLEWLDDKGFFVQESYNPETDELSGAGKLRLLQHQRDILGHCLTPNEKGKFPYTTLVYSCVKKSGKTTIGASIGAWAGDEFQDGSEIYCLANDEKQAKDRVFRDISYHVKRARLTTPLKSEIRYPNETLIQSLATEYKSAAGARHALTIWDELWAYTSDNARLMWAEMTPIPTVKTSLRVVVTYAGILGKSALLEDLYEKVVKAGEPVPELAHLVDARGDPVCFKKGRIFAYWDTVPRMPWQTPEYYEEQMELERPADFLRHHKNEWVTEFEEFIPMDWWTACETLDVPLELDKENKYQRWPIIIGVDVGVKHDCTAVAGVYYDSERKKVGLAFHRIWTPTPGQPLDLEATVETYLLQQKEKYNIHAVVYDPNQFHRSMTTLRDKFGVTMVEYPQSPSRMEMVGQAFYEAIRGKYLEVYPNDEVRSHIRHTTAENRGRGFRLVKGDRLGKPMDFSIAIAMAVHFAIDSGGVDVSRPIRIEIPFADASGWKGAGRQKQQVMPWELWMAGLTEMPHE